MSGVNRVETTAEAEAIAAVQAGEGTAFRYLVELYQDRVFRMCLLILRDSKRAEDLAQETFLAAYRHLPRFDSTKGTFAAWILTIARRLSLNGLEKSAPAIMAEPPEVEDLENLRPDRMASRQEAFRALDAALAELSPDHRRAFALAEIEELPHAEIAVIEGISVGTVKSRVSRAKEALRSRLAAVYSEIITSQDP